MKTNLREVYLQMLGYLIQNINFAVPTNTDKVYPGIITPILDNFLKKSENVEKQSLT